MNIEDLSPDLDSDILNVKDIQMTTKSFRTCVFILDELLSCFDCHQFLIPVPATAYVYHKEIAKPMDFRTLEYNLYNDKYKEFQEFIIDLNLIWNNAKQFHRSFDPIYQQADNLHRRFQNIVTFLDGGERPFYLSTSISSVDMVTDALLPEEKIETAVEIPFPMYKEIETKKKTNLYFVQALDEKDTLSRKMRGYANVRFLFQNLNSSFFHYIDTNSGNNCVLPLPRFYIAKNRTLLQQARVDPDGILAILCNVQLTQLNDDMIQVRATVIHCEPMDETHNFDENSLDKGEKYEYCPKAWLKLKIIRVVRDVAAVINTDIDKNFFRRAYNTFKLSTKSTTDIKKVGNEQLAKEFAHSILEPRSGNPGISAHVSTTPSATSSPKPQLEKRKQTSPKVCRASKLEAAILRKASSSVSNAASISRSVSPIKIKRSSSRPSATNNNTEETSKNANRTPLASLTPQPTTQEQQPDIAMEDVTRESNGQHEVAGKDGEDASNKPLTVKLIVKPSTPTPEPAIQEAPVNPKRIPSVVPASRSTDSDSDDETASYEYSDSDASDNNDDKPPQPKEVTKTPVQIDLDGDQNMDTTRENTVESTSIKSEVEETDISTVPTDVAAQQWKKVVSFAKEKNVPVIDINKYSEYKSTLPNAEGYFKHVFYAPHDRTKVIQTFKRMSLSQRTTEVVGLVALKGEAHIGQITEVLQEGKDGEIIGLCMQRYEKTLKHYTHAHSHHRLTAYQKMDLVLQMLKSMKTIHHAGIAHRDLSEVNFMVNSTQEKLGDGSSKAELFLIDFGKSVFVNPADYKRWWVAQKGHADNVPKTKEELEYWCEKLPWVRSKPDHGYRLYRSIQTLPKNRLDNENLPWLVNPVAEDLYSIGTLIWKTFSETEPWSGMLDTDLKGLREKVKDDYSIEKAIQRDVHGELSKQLLLKFLKVEPLQRQSAAEVLEWISNIHIQTGLIREWEQYAPVGRQKRHAKALFRYDEEQAHSNGSPRKKMK